MALRSSTPSSATFRPEIQGLRAIAVLLVIAFHADLGLPGGFVGVDVFFVVSGVVISRLLLDELDATGTIGVGSFLARRVRRLLPAFAVFVLVTVGISALILNPNGSLPFVMRSGISASLFVANGFLYQHTGYFDTAAQLNPFLHTWSLSVEEQFYLAFPVLLVVAARIRRSGVVTVVMMTAAISFALSWAMTEGWITFGLEAPARMAFLSSPTRAWEFCAGMLLTLSTRRGGRAMPTWVANSVGLLGVASIIAIAALFDPGAPFPAPLALVPVAGTIALLVPAKNPTWVTRVLGLAALTKLGDWSYGWYLWHWPAIVFARVLWPDAGYIAILAAGLSLVPAWASYRFIEQRFRNDQGITGARAARAALVCVALPALVASGLIVAAERTALGVTEPLGWYDLPDGRNAGCTLFNHDIANTWPDETCRTTVPSSKGTILVVGDQQADSASSGVIAAANELGYDTALWNRAGCPMIDRAPVHSPRCVEFHQEVTSLVDRLEPTMIVIANRSTAYTTDAAPTLEIADRRGRRVEGPTARVDEWADGLRSFVTRMADRDIGVIVVGGVPEYGSAFPRDRLSVLRPSISVPMLSRVDVAKDRAEVVAAEREVVDRLPTSRFVDPVPVLCSDVCRPEVSGVWWYYDDQHLTKTGSELLSGALRSAMLELSGLASAR